MMYPSLANLKTAVKILPALQAVNTFVLGHTYNFDDDVFSLFQRAADAVDPLRIPTSQQCGGGGDGCVHVYVACGVPLA
jgi:hypothetical protein